MSLALPLILLIMGAMAVVVTAELGRGHRKGRPALLLNPRDGDIKPGE
jgi:hypothetical protein